MVISTVHGPTRVVSLTALRGGFCHLHVTDEEAEHSAVQWCPRPVL